MLTTQAMSTPSKGADAALQRPLTTNILVLGGAAAAPASAAVAPPTMPTDEAPLSAMPTEVLLVPLAVKEGMAVLVHVLLPPLAHAPHLHSRKYISTFSARADDDDEDGSKRGGGGAGGGAGAAAARAAGHASSDSSDEEDEIAHSTLIAGFFPDLAASKGYTASRWVRITHSHAHDMHSRRRRIMCVCVCLCVAVVM